MIAVRRLAAVVAFLAVAAFVTSSDVWGDPKRDKELKDWRKGDGKHVRPAKEEATLAKDLDKSRFADAPLVVYKGAAEQLFALQLRPQLADPTPRPTDYLIIVDTSASKALGPLVLAVQMIRELVAQLGAGDRVALWTANIKPKSLSRGFKDAKGMEEPLADLAKEIPLGAVNLKLALTEALASLEPTPGRHRAVIFLGDGKSIAGPLDVDGRAALCDAMVRKQVAFFAVPLGLRLDPQNLHSLVSGTGGKVVRHGIGEAVKPFVERLKKDVAEPILYAESFTLPAAATAVVPSRLPPLRRDGATLVVGKLAGTKSISYKIAGSVAGRAVSFDATVAVPPADEDNYFLTGIYNQWKARRDRPALLVADRALAYAYKQNQLALEDLLTKAELALESNQLDAAARLYEQARLFAPHSDQAKGGLVMVARMRSGKMKLKDVLTALRVDAAKRQFIRVENGKRRVVVLGDGDERAPDKGGAGPKDGIEDIRARRRVAAQLAEAMIAEAIRQANRLVRTDPDEAYRILKERLDDLRGNTELEAAALTGLANRVSRAMENVARLGATVKRDMAEALALRAAADARLDLRRAETLAQDRIRERMRVFHNMMDQAREEQAYKQALSIRNDLVAAGQPVPPAVTAAYQIALSGYHLREVQELRRLREERFLATLLEVERSHVPFPDEPPVEYPSSAVIKRLTRGQFENWRDWSKDRIARYAVTTFTSDNPGRLEELRRTLQKVVTFEGLDDKAATLENVLELLSKTHRVTFDVNEDAFKAEGLNEPLRAEVANPPILRMDRVNLSTVLKRILARVPVPSGATYIVRRDVIEITTGQAAVAEKTLRVYYVGDLVFPVPSAFNQNAVGQVASIFGALGTLGLGGGGLALGGGLAGGLALGGGLAGGLALGGGLQVGGLALGGGLQVGGLALGGGLQVGGLALGGGLQVGGLALGGGLQVGGLALGGGINVGGLQAGVNVGLQGGLAGGFNFQGNVNLGVGGGFAGFGGGQLGQLGNLGGQFGIQGGTQEQILITMIRQVVGTPKDWLPQYNPITGQPLNPLDDQVADGPGLGREDNQLGYVPVAAALVVKGSARFHTQDRKQLFSKAGAGAGAGGGMVLGPREGGGVLVGGRRPAVRVAGEGDDKKKDKKDLKNLDPRKVWQDALARGVKDPGLIIATADFLALNEKFDHAAEFLKANLRQGIIVRPWVYRSLAIALRESGGSAEEIERAELSAADLEPMNATSYLLAARSLAEDGNYDRAIAFCKQAAELEPNVPHAYSDAVRYADMAKDPQAMAWAAGRLLRQDWPIRNAELQSGADEKLNSLAGRLDRAAAANLRESVKAHQRRDLVVRLAWQGEADLDLQVEEPSGSICSPLTRQSIGGGTLIADTLATMTSETYVAAEGFRGEYKVIVRRVWGKPLGNKAQLKIIRHQGTPNETEQLVTVKVVSTFSEPVLVKLDDGRRTEAAYVPLPAAHRPPDDGKEGDALMESTDQILTRLRQLADPTVTRIEQPRGLTGDVGGPGRAVSSRRASFSSPSERDRTLYQTRVNSLVGGSADVTAQAVISHDRRSVRLNLSGVFRVVTPGPIRPVTVVNPIFPGGVPPRP